MFKQIIIIGCVFTFGCATMQPKPMVYHDGRHDPVQYRQDLATCESWAESAAYEGTPGVGDGVVGGAIAGSLLSAGLGAVLGAVIGFDPGLGAAVGAATGAYTGGISGGAVNYAERERRRKEAVVMCLRKHGHEAAY